MCRVFASQDPDGYVVETRSVRLSGQCTSIRLERAFWTILEEIAAEDGTSLPRFLAKLHDEVVEARGEVGNFASVLRCCCLIQLRGRATAPDFDTPNLYADA